MMGHNAELVLVEKSDNCLAFYDLERGVAEARIPLAIFPHEIVADHRRGIAYVGHYGVHSSKSVGDGGASVFVVDLRQRKLVNTLDCRPYGRIHGLGLDTSGRLYALSETAGVLLVFDDGLTGQAPSRAALTGGLKSHLFSLTADGQVAFVMNLLTHTVTKIAPHDPTITPLSLKPGIHPEGNCLTRDEKTLYVTNRGSATIAKIDTTRFSVEEVYPVRDDPTRVYLAGDDRLLVTYFNGRSLSIFDAASFREIGFIEFEGRPAAACLHPNGTTAYVSLESNQSVEIDIKSGKVAAVRSTGAEPDACFVIPAEVDGSGA